MVPFSLALLVLLLCCASTLSFQGWSSPLVSRLSRCTRRSLTDQEYIACLEKDKEILHKDKEFLFKVMQKDKESLFNQGQGIPILLSAKYVGEINLCPLVETMLFGCFPDLTATDAAKEVVKEFFEHPDDPTSLTIKPEWEKKMEKLEGHPVNAPEVAREVKVVFHKLSTAVYHTYLAPLKHGPGFFLGGKAPLRVAAGILILRLQEIVEMEELDKIGVHYCDEHFVPRLYLSGGQCYSI